MADNNDNINNENNNNENNDDHNDDDLNNNNQNNDDDQNDNDQEEIDQDLDQEEIDEINTQQIVPNVEIVNTPPQENQETNAFLDEDNENDEPNRANQDNVNNPLNQAVLQQLSQAFTQNLVNMLSNRLGQIQNPNLVPSGPAPPEDDESDAGDREKTPDEEVQDIVLPNIVNQRLPNNNNSQNGNRNSNQILHNLRNNNNNSRNNNNGDSANRRNNNSILNILNDDQSFMYNEINWFINNEKVPQSLNNTYRWNMWKDRTLYNINQFENWIRKINPNNIKNKLPTLSSNNIRTYFTTDEQTMLFGYGLIGTNHVLKTPSQLAELHALTFNEATQTAQLDEGVILSKPEIDTSIFEPVMNPMKNGNKKKRMNQ